MYKIKTRKYFEKIYIFWFLVDDQEDDVTGDTALICKTLKHGAERRHCTTCTFYTLND